jgi:hypothetical protein
MLRRGRPFHEPSGSDDPLLQSLRQSYLFAVGRETPRIPETLRTVISGELSLPDWLESVHFRDGWLVSAAHATISVWETSGYDGLLRMPTQATELFQHGVPGTFTIHIDYPWLAHRGQGWAKFRQFIMEEVEARLEKYRVESEQAWGKQRKVPSFEAFGLLARYQANEIRNPDETEYVRIKRTAQHIGLTLRPRNKRIKQGG